MKKNSIIYLLGAILLISFSILPISDLNSTDDQQESWEPPTQPRVLEVGQEEWWNVSYAYRMQVNVTNPGATDFVDTYASFSFNYSFFVEQGNMNESMKDVRIVENDILRPYYIQNDYPSVNMARVWFQTNCSADTSEFDTFMYYGNDTLDFDNVYLLPYNPMGVMWQTFDEIYGGDTIKDSSQSNDGDIIDTPQISIDAKAGNSMYFGGDSNPGSVNLGNPTDLQITGDQTIAMWIKPQQLYNRQNPYVKAYGGEGTITLETSGSFSYYYGQGGGNTDPYQGFGSGTGTASAGNWVHIAIVRDLTNGQLRWYEDGGVAAQTSAVYNPAFTSTLDALIGRGYVSHFWGYLDELHVFDAALSYNEINRLRDYTYSCNAELLDEVEQGAQVEITIRDVDGLPVPNAEVSLYNSSGLAVTEYSDDSGLTIFSTIDYGYYNMTVNYTLQETGDEETVFTGNATNGFLHFTGLLEEETFYVDLWSIDFSVFDADGDIMDYGYVEVYDSTKTILLANLTLNHGSGTQLFRWLNTSSYYYKVYYHNDDYSVGTVLLNDTTLDRTDLANSITYNINETSSGSFYSDNYIYAEGSNSTFINSTRLVNATIYVSEIVDNLDKIDLYYINVNGTEVPMIDASKTYTAETEDTINVQLADVFDAYGLRIYISGTNNTQCDGKVEVNYTQTTSQRITGNISKISLRIIDETNKNPVPGVIVHVYSGNVEPGNSVVNLTTDDDGYAHGVQNSDLEFWYLQGTYNFTLEFFDDNKFFNVNYTDPGQWNASNVEVYNYTVSQASTLLFEIRIDMSQFQTHIYSLDLPTEVDWGEMMNFEVNFTYTSPTETDQPITEPDSITCTITGSIVHPEKMTHIGGGIFQAIVNSSLFSAGTAQNMLTVEVTGEKAGYVDPQSLLFLVTLNPIATKISLHDYANDMTEITNATISAYYNENVNLSIAYLKNQTDTKISGASVSYYWDYGADTDVKEDPLNPGYYTISIFTGDAPNIGKYGLHMTISLENYTYQTTVAFIDILARPTVLNSTSTDETQELLRITKTLNESDVYFFDFTYREVLGNQESINNTDISSFTWQYTTGDTNGQGDLTLFPNGIYQLDFNTSSRSVGDYIILVTFSKSNFEQRQAMIFLTIEKRIIDYELLGDFNGIQFSKIKGDQWNLTVHLEDQSRGFSDLTTATVEFYVDYFNYSVSLVYQNHGIYQTILNWDNLKSVFSAGTYAAHLTISNDTFTTTQLEITLIIQNRTADLTFQGGFNETAITEVKGDIFVFEVTLIDVATGQPIEDASVYILIPQISLSIELKHQGNGVYSETTDFSNISAFYRDASFSAKLVIEIENYDLIEKNIVIKIKMQEIFEGFPTFYLLLGVVGLIIAIGSLVGYKLVQNARIPAFVKMINKVISDISGKKIVSDEIISVSSKEEIIEKFGEYWTLLDLDLNEILGLTKESVPSDEVLSSSEEATGGI